ncbi:hypothetical protein [Amycolatopsis balhimycina]|uniref:hypothetical protein n=1 Tax=Amycolatopsis balhimycina TaxID=208443 RepID=UPI00039FB3F3|nr:hypothetical protein [Amycolatopsis balhimycina]
MISAEAQYRTLVRVLPAWYRAERGDEMVGTLLDLHGERARAALWSELWALLALGVRTRLAARARRPPARSPSAIWCGRSRSSACSGACSDPPATPA